MIRKIAAPAAACLASFTLLPSTAHCIDGIAAEVGHGYDDTNVLRISVTDRWRTRGEPAAPQWRLAGYWEFTVGIWDNPDESTAEIALTPVFRFQRRAFYVEGAIGFHLVQTRISADRTFSTAFQFGDHVGAGIVSGKYDFGVRVQHISNANLAKPNPGINFLLLRLEYSLE